MKDEDLLAITESIESKIGKEASGMIADDIGKLLTANTEVNNFITKQSEEIKSLKDRNEKLVVANGNLLQQIPMASEYDTHQSKKEEKEEQKSFDFRSVFDSKGNFKK